MKLRKSAKRFLTIILIIAIIIGGYFAYKTFIDNGEVKEVKVIHRIPKYGYELKDNKDSRYKKMFYQLEKILKKSDVSEEKYVKKISEMFIYDFYTLSNKSAKTDIGGTDFVYNKILDNFILNAEDTYYKYVESNIYNQRHQDLPKVTDIKIDNVEKTSFKYDDKEEKTKTKYDDKEDTEAYKVKVSWKYNSGKYDSYQNEATLVFIHDGIKLVLVELQ
ncbi:MAG: hypothetical protein IKG58_01095 [Bacilli bacterium]|nr:hypothetical protein [Bacilli bacterium]MBR3049141.1 hypothetical protein [Bacilli bacterium]